MQELRTSFNPAARRVLTLASQHAATRSAAFVEPEHLLLALASTPGAASTALGALQVEPSALCADLHTLLPVGGAAASAPREGPALERIRHYAWKEAAHLGHRQIDALHLLLGILYEEAGSAVELLRRHELSIYDLRSHMQQTAALTVPLRPPLRGVVQPSALFLLLVGLAAGSGAWLLFNPPERLVQALTIMFVLAGYITCLCLHEFGHALAAYLGGDNSVVGKGYLTLDPRRYTHPLLSIVLPLVFLLLGGFGLPGGAVYIDRRALRTRRWASFMSAAGPLATLLCLVLLSWPFYFDWLSWTNEQNYAFWPALALLCFLQVTALVFNLLPIPSLDGFGILAPWLDPDPRVYQFGQILIFLMFYILWQDTPLSGAFWGNMYGIGELLHVPAEMVSYGWEQFFGR